jgi:glycosyltransferase involved in cell wall biosynthesis
MLLARPMKRARPKISILYHFFHPDDVVSARHFSGLAEDLAAAGFDVEVLPSNRSCRNNSACYPARESWQGIKIRRVWRPALDQSSTLGRLLNAFWMLASWSALALRGRSTRPDVVLVGTDPVLSVLVTLPLKWLRPEMKVTHWAFDLYPEAAIADGLVSPSGWKMRALTGLLRRAYHRCDLIADLGVCMKQRLRAYGERLPLETIVPWAIAEAAAPQPPEPELRCRVFGDTRLAILYSGNFGRAHSFHEFFALARRMRSPEVQFRWSVRGNAVSELQAEIQPSDSNISLLPFVPEKELSAHLAAADIHMVSLRPDWSGIVVPSKFFGSLAAGRPVLYAGPEDSSVAHWIRQYRVGWVLTESTLTEVETRLRQLADNPELLAELQAHCHKVYQDHFSREKMMGVWVAQLSRLLRLEQLPARAAHMEAL